MPLIDVKLPATATLLNGPLMEIATFDLLPTDEIYPIIFNLDLEQEEPLNDQWASVGFDTGNFIMNMGSIFLAFLYLFLSFAILGMTSFTCCL